MSPCRSASHAAILATSGVDRNPGGRSVLVRRTRRGPASPPPLGARIEWRPDGSKWGPWWAIAANGAVLLITDSLQRAQERLSALKEVT